MRDYDVPKFFYPSYDVPDRDSYLERVGECEEDSQLPLWKREDPTCKRYLHKMIVGGRMQRSYPDGGSYPKDPRLGGPSRQQERVEGTRGPIDPKERETGADFRLAPPPDGINPPWKKRTQSPLTSPRVARPNTGEQVLVQQIAEVIQRVREGQPTAASGFAVPDNAATLITAGMPPKTAYILVKRAGGSFISDVPLSLLDKPTGRPPTLSDRIYLATGAYLHGTTDGAVGLRREDGSLYAVRVVSGGHAQVLVEPSKINAIGEDIEADLRSFERRAFRLADHWGVLEVVVQFWFKRRKGPLEIPLSQREHSKLSDEGARSSEVQYKSLRNILLSDLPHFLARLTRRRVKEGRRLPLLPSHLAEKNPMSHREDYLLWLEQFSQAPFGAQQSLPTARRNMAGRPGQFGLPRSQMPRPKGMINFSAQELRDLDTPQAHAELAWRKDDRALRADMVIPERRDVPKSAKAQIHLSYEEASKGEKARRVKRKEAVNAYRERKPVHSASSTEGSDEEIRAEIKRLRAENEHLRAAKKAKKNSGQRRPLTEAQIAAGFGGKAAKRAFMKRNPWFDHDRLWLPDDTQVRTALVPRDSSWSDDTLTRSALVEGPYAFSNPYSQFAGQFGTNEEFTEGRQPMSRRNARRNGPNKREDWLEVQAPPRALAKRNWGKGKKRR